MSHPIDPNVMYRIRSRGVQRPAVEGHRLPQLVRDFALARHDELSEDGELWFSASEVESLFPSAASARLIRERLSREPSEHAEEFPTQVEDDRKFPREPWYVARASNVAGPYDQLTITQWYEQGFLRDTDQLRPGLHAKWRPLATARNEGLLAPPPANTCSVNPIHLVADPPVWMEPPTTRATITEDWAPATQQSDQFHSTPFASNLPLILATVGVLVLFFASLVGLAWFVLNLNRQHPDPADSSERVSGRAGLSCCRFDARKQSGSGARASVS
jgi:hypothetical protein